MGGYITENGKWLIKFLGEIDLKKLNKYFRELGLIEEVLIKNIERQ
jgi:hypothetical protein